MNTTPELLAPITPESILLTKTSLGKDGSVKADFTFATVRFRAKILRTTIELVRLDNWLVFDPTRAAQVASTKYIQVVLGTLEGSRPLATPDDADEIRAILAEALDAAIGAEALARYSLLREALWPVAERHGLANPWFHAEDEELGGPPSVRRTYPRFIDLRVGGFSPRAFVRRMRTLHDALRPLENFSVPLPMLSAHERLDLATRVYDGFALRGIDIGPWFAALHVDL